MGEAQSLITSSQEYIYIAELKPLTLKDVE